MDTNKLDQQYQEGRDWAYEIYESSRLHARRWFIISCLGLGLGIAGCLAVLALTPLKTTELQIVKVEAGKSIELLDAKSANQYQPEEWASRADLANYIKDRETIDTNDFDQRFERIRLRSESRIYDEYFKGYERDNPQSPLNTHSNKFKRSIEVNAVSFLNNNTASIRFTAIDSKTNTKDQYVSIVGYRYQPGLKMSEQERYNNPLGFLVTHYRRDLESSSAGQ
jgi:type IV secretion system protein VirB8